MSRRHATDYRKSSSSSGGQRGRVCEAAIQFVRQVNAAAKSLEV